MSRQSVPYRPIECWLYQQVVYYMHNIFSIFILQKVFCCLIHYGIWFVLTYCLYSKSTLSVQTEMCANKTVLRKAKLICFYVVFSRFAAEIIPLQSPEEKPMCYINIISKVFADEINNQIKPKMRNTWFSPAYSHVSFLPDYSHVSFFTRLFSCLILYSTYLALCNACLKTLAAQWAACALPIDVWALAANGFCSFFNNIDNFIDLFAVKTIPCYFWCWGRSYRN